MNLSTEWEYIKDKALSMGFQFCYSTGSPCYKLGAEIVRKENNFRAFFKILKYDYAELYLLEELNKICYTYNLGYSIEQKNQNSFIISIGLLNSNYEKEGVVLIATSIKRLILETISLTYFMSSTVSGVQETLKMRKDD